MIRAVCFDFDGTLAHFTGDFELLLDSFRSDLMLTQCDMRGFAGTLSSALRREGEVTLHSAVLETLERSQVRPSEDLGDLITRAVADYSAQMALLPGALDVLNFCRDREMPLALLTNGPADMQCAAVWAVGIETYFKRILISGDPEVAVRKPDPRIFGMACEALSSRPEETLMVGDNLEADVRGALLCEMQAVVLGGEAGPGYEAMPDLRAFGTWLKAHV